MPRVAVPLAASAALAVALGCLVGGCRLPLSSTCTTSRDCLAGECIEGQCRAGVGEGDGGCGSPSARCEGADLRGATCATAVAAGWTGSLACTGTCDFDTSACTTPATTYAALDDRSKWATFDVSTLNRSAKGYVGAVFADPYLYLVPYDNGSPHGLVARYDTGAMFDSMQAWSFFDVSVVSSNAVQFSGGVFDGRYIYLIPNTSGTVARYDTSGAFASRESWSTFELMTLNPALNGYTGGAFDGRYVYFAPLYNGEEHGNVVRYDTQMAFSSSQAWSAINVSTFNSAARAFAGALFDGRHVYFVPTRSVVARYDTTKAFGSSDAWSTFDVAGMRPGAGSFWGATFDGQHVYFSPYMNDMMARYDAQLAFEDVEAWSFFYLRGVNSAIGGSSGIAFDGRFVTVISHSTMGSSSIATRFDTQGDFETRGSWATFDVAMIYSSPSGFAGIAFDGRHIYLAPDRLSGTDRSGVAARFDAKSPAWLPRLWNASFL